MNVCIKETRTEENMCSICLCGLTSSGDNITTTCNHVFHKECIDRWIGQSDNCPLCRKNSPIRKEPILRNRDLLVSSIILMPDDVVDDIEYFFGIIGSDEDVFDEFHFINQMIISNIGVFVTGSFIEKQNARADMLISISRRTREILIRRALE